MEPAPAHACRFALRVRWEAWRMAGAFRERGGYRVPACVECGRLRPSRRPRVPSLVELESAAAAAAPAPDAAGRSVAAELVRRAASAPAVGYRGLQGALVGRGIPASLLDHWIEAFLRAGWTRLAYRLHGSRRALVRVSVLDARALEEFVRPGARAARVAALGEARSAVAPLVHPVGRDVARLLDDADAARWGAGLIHALAAVAIHAESGDVLASRVFSARYLGDSKALAALRPRLEKLLGRLEALGIRDGAAATFLGGAGRLRVGSAELDLQRLPPFVGLARDTLLGPLALEPPPAGLLAVENFAAFEACCRGEVAVARDAVVVWTAGYPGRGVRRLVEEAARSGARVRVWADIDLDGVRIARLLASWIEGGVETFRMSPDDLPVASAARPLAARATTAIRADLAEQPDAFLASTLRALLDAGRWVEQEAFLGP